MWSPSSPTFPAPSFSPNVRCFLLRVVCGGSRFASSSGESSVRSGAYRNGALGWAETAEAPREEDCSRSPGPAPASTSFSSAGAGLAGCKTSAGGTKLVNRFFWCRGDDPDPLVNAPRDVGDNWPVTK